MEPGRPTNTRPTRAAASRSSTRSGSSTSAPTRCASSSTKARCAPVPLFNEKVLCGLGRSVATTGHLGHEAVERALAALRRFRAIADILNVRACAPSPRPPCAKRRTASTSSRGGEGLRHGHRGALRRGGSRARGAGHHDGLHARRRLRRRPRWRQPRAHRHSQAEPRRGDDDAARRPASHRHHGKPYRQGGDGGRSAARACRGWPRPAARSTRSAARGARWPGCTWSSPITHCA